MASAVNSLGASDATSTSAATAAADATANTAPSESVFLQLLVSQIQNQDPLNPTDSTQFVSQLAQFSELEQVVAIRSDIETAMSANSSASSANNTSTGASTDSANAAPSSTGASGTSNNSTGTSTN